MKRFAIFLFCLGWCTWVHGQYTGSQLTNIISTNLPTQTTRSISASNVRDVFEALRISVPNLADSSVSTTEFGYLDGVTSSIQTQINSKGTGSVTSVGVSAPSILTVGSSPVTTSGTISLTLATQSANTVFSGPTTGSAATPTFRALVVGDLPTAIPLTSLATQAQATLLGRYTASTGVPQVITIGSGLSLNSSTGELTASGGGSSTNSDLTGYLTIQPDTISLSGGAAATDASVGNTFNLDANQSFTLSNPTSTKTNQVLHFRIKNTAATNIVCTLDSKFRFGEDITALPAFTNSKKYHLTVRWDDVDDKFDVVGFVGGF